MGLQLTNICVIGVPKEEEQGDRKVFEETMAAIFINWRKAINLYSTDPLNSMNPKHKKC